VRGQTSSGYSIRYRVEQACTVIKAGPLKEAIKARKGLLVKLDDLRDWIYETLNEASEEAEEKYDYLRKAV
jgi:2-phosphoglycerate kinase